MSRTVVHRTGLMPPSSGPIKTWCGMAVPIGNTARVDHRPNGFPYCRRCQAVAGRKRRLGIWPWGRPTKRGAK